MSVLGHWTEPEAVAVLRALNAELDEDDALSAWQVIGPMVAPLHRYQGAVAENEQLRSALDVMTVDRDSWKALAGELVEQRDDARRAAGGQ